MAERIVVGLDIGTTKVCVLVGEVREGGQTRILGVGIAPSRGVQGGMVADIGMASEAVSAAKRQAELSSGYEIGRAFVCVGGKHISSVNQQGAVGLNSRAPVAREDMERALDNACAIELPHQRDVLHVIPRFFTVDQRRDIPNPLGQYGYRLEVDAHIISVDTSALISLEDCVRRAGLEVDRFIVNPLASAEAALSEAERASGVLLVDIGAGTTGVALFDRNAVLHTAVMPIGGNHITNDIAQILHLPPDEAEHVKIEYGVSLPEMVGPDEVFNAQRFGEESFTSMLRHELAQIIEARVDEIFTFVKREIKRSGYDGLLTAGVVLTGGSAALVGIQHNASRVMNLPARVAAPEKLSGLADKLRGPAYSAVVGLLRFSYQDQPSRAPGSGSRRERRTRGPDIGKAITDFFGRLLPD